MVDVIGNAFGGADWTSIKWDTFRLWSEQPETTTLLMAVKEQAQVQSPLAVFAVIQKVVERTKRDGTFDLTYSQLGSELASLVSESQLRNIVQSLTRMGVLITVVPARSSGRGGGAGRAPVRRLCFIGVGTGSAEASTDEVTPNGRQDSSNGGQTCLSPLKDSSKRKERLSRSLQSNQKVEFIPVEDRSDFETWETSTGKSATKLPNGYIQYREKSSHSIAHGDH